MLRCFQSYLSPEDLEKSYIQFSNNTLEIGTVNYKFKHSN